MRDIGAANRDNVKKLLPALGLYPFTQRLRMTPQQFAELIARAQQEADTHNLKAYFPFKNCRRDGCDTQSAILFQRLVESYCISIEDVPGLTARGNHNVPSSD
ncbi:unnamed protein product [Aspergillus oryzae RIB40]|uniref:DNA, SC026 n=2 Tax=Aspergillus oryzae TaxID=5062 RepID=Q2UER9_ASPOR|nr:unnamed protein product [Aspergillus oryzae RIB40]EIT77986.1 UMTA methyltransferase family protein [Aspergillus oryzae 3.042]KDE79430.1 UMTA methyltransferase family protein [Aspergillus oryzae 100-8]BAE59946.1 unnamed protein product [Aspergillus oryzae RIB40]|eukprot:EIT77986.1 UMTA methyltransferase family protein [Aspergillus oryzae 3.042]